MVSGITSQLSLNVPDSSGEEEKQSQLFCKKPKARDDRPPSALSSQPRTPAHLTQPRSPPQASVPAAPCVCDVLPRLPAKPAPPLLLSHVPNLPRPTPSEVRSCPHRRLLRLSPSTQHSAGWLYFHLSDWPTSSERTVWQHRGRVSGPLVPPGTQQGGPLHSSQRTSSEPPAQPQHLQSTCPWDGDTVPMPRHCQVTIRKRGLGPLPATAPSPFSRLPRSHSRDQWPRLPRC